MNHQWIIIDVIYKVLIPSDISINVSVVILLQVFKLVKYQCCQVYLPVFKPRYNKLLLYKWFFPIVYKVNCIKNNDLESIIIPNSKLLQFHVQ